MSSDEFLWVSITALITAGTGIPTVTKQAQRVRCCCWWCNVFHLRSHSTTVVTAASPRRAWDPSNSKGKKCLITLVSNLRPLVLIWTFYLLRTAAQNHVIYCLRKSVTAKRYAPVLCPVERNCHYLMSCCTSVWLCSQLLNCNTKYDHAWSCPTTYHSDVSQIISRLLYSELQMRLFFFFYFVLHKVLTAVEYRLVEDMSCLPLQQCWWLRRLQGYTRMATTAQLINS